MKRLWSLSILVCFLTVLAWAEDWPQFRYDAGRTAASPHELPADLQLSWSRTLPTPKPAFPREIRLAYDASYEPVVLDRRMFVPSMVTDSVTALDTETGKQHWRFFTEGPVRFAPVAWQGKVYFVSDDGYLYCVDAATGTLRWKFRGLTQSKQPRKVIGHGRLVSLWPARGGPVLAEGVIYFAAGIWPSEGIFVHAVDARSGQAVWSNIDGGHIPQSNWDHGVGQTAGLTPQGYLAIIGKRLVVPCGTQLPAFLDIKTGQLQRYTMGWGGRDGLPKGGWFVAGIGNYLSHSGDLYDITRPSKERFADLKPDRRDYRSMLYPGGWMRLLVERANQRELDRLAQSVITPEVMYESDGRIIAHDLTSYTVQERPMSADPKQRDKEKFVDNFSAVFNRLWELPSTHDVHIKAGNRLYVGGPGVVEAIDTKYKEPKVVWRVHIQGTPHRMLAADEKLFVVTSEGRILAFAAPDAAISTSYTHSIIQSGVTDKWTERTDALLKATGIRSGYALVLGIESGRLIEELVRQSKLHIIAVDKDPATVAAVRDRLLARGLYGTRASVVVGDPANFPFSPYLASLVVSEIPDDLNYLGERTFARTVFHTLRPYGGVAVAWGPLSDRKRTEQIIRNEAFPGAHVQEVGGFVLLTRPGSLPGVADWSHAQANAAETGASQDEFIRSPMTVLWFDAAERWHKFPGQLQIRVAGGRLVLLEDDMLQASDVYTGRKLWQVKSPLPAKPSVVQDTREAIRYAKHRQWGPAPSLASTTQMIVIEDGIYLSAGRRCYVVDPASGQTIGQIDLPEDLDTPWANLRIDGNNLVGSSGNHILCVDRRTSELRWRIETTHAALSLAVGKGKVFCAELILPKKDQDKSNNHSMFALNIDSGERVWQKPGGVRLRYSDSLDIVVTPTGFYRGSDGESLPWQADTPERLVFKAQGLPKEGVPGIITGDTLLTGNEQSLDFYTLPSGERSGETLTWNRRGCTGLRFSTHLVTTRYFGNSAWIDLNSRTITPLLGVRPACRVNNNLYPANGVLSMPNLTAGCTCNYTPISTACIPVDVARPGSGK
jgi:outer membrane protein assembly factor BamB